MRSMMSRSPFSRSPRTNQDSTFPSPNPGQSGSTPPLIAEPARPEASRNSSYSRELRGMRRLEQRRSMEQHHYQSCRARAQNYNPPADLRLLDYVTPYDNNLMCPICRCPFVDPVILNECDHCFCRDCIRQTWNSNNTYTPLGPRGDCPSCRTPAKLGPRSAICKILINMTDELLVKCPKADTGCKAEIKRGEVQDHLNIYCGYAMVECVAEDCELPVLRKDAAQGCLHYGVSCLSCHRELQKWKLESHWQNECPDRKVYCDLCNSPVFYRDLEEHNNTACPAMSIPCPGAAFGCSNKSKRGQAEIHAKACAIARLAPMLTKQQERLDEQEAAQKQMSRKLELLQNGLATMHDILNPSTEENRLDRATTRLSRSSVPQDERMVLSSPALRDEGLTGLAIEGLAESPATNEQLGPVRLPPIGPAPDAPGPRPSDIPESYSADFDLETPNSFPPPDTSGGPYASPLHHLLSMHESLRDEISRISTALSDLDGRHSMQIINENLRTREEITYLGAQVGGLQRQVHWLTSAQLQRQQVGGRATPGPSSSISDAAAGAGVEAAVSAVNTAATALRGAARVVNVGGWEGREGGQVMERRRGLSEEGRTKL